MKSILIIFEIWTLLAFIGMILIYFRNDAYLVFEDWKTIKNKQKTIQLIITIILVYFILPFSIPYSISHIHKK
jgi:undecaprenyl pyrophosphate phosphatase UppP